MTATTPELRAKSWLATSDLRPTRQRIALAELLVGDGQNRHVTAEWLHRAADEADMSVSLATVYNTLRSFSDAGLITEITVDGGKSYFDTRPDDHTHFYVEEEGRVMDVPDGSVNFDRLPEPPSGMEIDRVDVVIRLRRKG
ncbi:MAG: iron response transcriptional regulator IrrA [Pseudomonadota bacterium]